RCAPDRDASPRNFLAQPQSGTKRAEPEARLEGERRVEPGAAFEWRAAAGSTFATGRKSHCAFDFVDLSTVEGNRVKPRPADRSLERCCGIVGDPARSWDQSQRSGVAHQD